MNYKPLYVDTDSVSTPLGEIKQDINSAIKTYLNSIYGTGVVKYKESKNMKREYIVLHKNGRTGVVFKDSIDAVAQGEHETVIIIKGRVEFCDDKYEDVVRQLLK